MDAGFFWQCETDTGQVWRRIRPNSYTDRNDVSDVGTKGLSGTMAEKRNERRLAAIMAADIVGYSKLMGADEEGTLARLIALRKDAVDPALARWGGRIVKSTGDGLLVEFHSAVDAVRTALALHDRVAAMQDAGAEAGRLTYRIGINIGDLIVEDGDLFGDGVNVAARLEALAPPGGVVVSRAVIEQVGALPDLVIDDLGDKALKNIDRPIRVFRLRRAGDASAVPGPALDAAWWRGLAFAAAAAAAGGLYAWFDQSRTAPAGVPPANQVASVQAAAQTSVAVLPFANLGGAKDDDYIGDGIAEDLITDLAKLSSLTVIARNSTFAYKGQAVNVPDVARSLGVRYVLEGSVRRSGDRLRITAQLIDATTGGHLWAERYDRDLKEVFALQDEVREKIVAALGTTLAPSERALIARRTRGPNQEAYALLIRAFELRNAFTREAILEARRLLEQSVRLDPTYARAYVQLASTYVDEIDGNWTSDAEGNAERALGYARAAVKMDETLPEAYWILARVHLRRAEHAEALAEIERALAFSPGFAGGRALRGTILSYFGRAKEGVVEIERAMVLNPLHPFWYVDFLGRALYWAGEVERAVPKFRNAIERNHNWPPQHYFLVASLGELDRRDEAEWAIAEASVLGLRMSLSQIPSFPYFGDEGQRRRFTEAWRKAGVPETIGK